MFEGRLFPHPMDDGWHQSGGYGDGYSHGKIRVYRGYIMIDGVTVRDSDERAVRYYEAIDAACKRRAIDKALEALP